jgi:probable blue pigment (indigoidine) exporter
MLVGAAGCWGIGTVISKQVLDRGVAPMTLLILELLASCLLLSLIALVRRVSWSMSSSTQKLTVLGVLNPGLAYALGLLGLTQISASMSVLIWAAEPVLILALAILILRQKIAGATIVAIAAAVIGVFLVVYRPDAEGQPLGIALTMAAVLACASYTVLTQKLLLDDASAPVVLLQQVAALAFALVVTGVATAADVAQLGLPGDLTTWAMVVASGTVYYGLAFTFFLTGLRDVPAATAGAFLPLIPVFGLAAAYVAGERLFEQQWLGASLVLVAAGVVAFVPADQEPVVRASER